MVVVVEIIRIPSGPFSTNTYVLYTQEEDEAVVIDPAPSCSGKVFKALEMANKRLSAVWLTHSHWDHTAGYSELSQEPFAKLETALYEVPLLVHELDAENLIHPGSDGIPSFVPLQPIHPSKTLLGGETLTCGASEWTVLHTPGHSMGCVCFYCPKEGLLFTGDTIFRGTYGNVSFPKSSVELMQESIAFLSLLPPQTKIYPGHGPATILSNELSWMK